MAEIRFHLDENVDPDIALALRQHGIDVTTTLQVGLRTQSDSAQFDFVRREQRVLVTHDSDFLRIASEMHNHPGIVYCAKNARSMGEIIRSLILIFEILSPEEIEGKVEYI